MSMIDVDLGDVQEPELIAKDTEVEVRILSAEEGITGENSKNPGMATLNIQLDIPAHELAPNVYHTLMIPTNELKESNFKTWNFVGNIFKEFLEAFDLAPPFDPSNDLPGKTAWAIIDVNTYQGRTNNRIKRFLPKR